VLAQESDGFALERRAGGNTFVTCWFSANVWQDHDAATLCLQLSSAFTALFLGYHHLYALDDIASEAQGIVHCSRGEDGVEKERVLAAKG